jgi:hypothetical protein
MCVRATCVWCICTQALYCCTCDPHHTPSPIANTLQNCHVSSFEEGDIAAAASRIQELDLRANLISNITDVVTVGKQLPGLKQLNLSENRFRPES